MFLNRFEHNAEVCSMRTLVPESCIRMVMAAWIALPVLLFSIGCSPGGGAGAVPANTHATLLLTATNNAKIPIFKFNIQTVRGLLFNDGGTLRMVATEI